MFARTTILPGEEITASYIPDEDTLLPFHRRQQRLLEDFGFLCACVACARGCADDTLLAKCRNALESWNLIELENLAASGNHEEHLKGTINDMRFLGRIGMLDRAHLQLFYYHAAWGNRAKAINAAKEVLAGLAGKFGWEEARWLPEAQWVRDPEKWEGWGSMLVSRDGELWLTV